MSSLKRKTLKEFLAMLLTLAMIFTGVHVPFVYADGTQAGKEELQNYGGVTSSEEDGMPKIIAGVATGAAMTLDTTTDLTAFVAGDKVDGDSEKAGTENYFTLIYSEKTKVDSSSKTFEDGYKGTQRVNFGGTASLDKNVIKFSTNAKANVKVYWAQGGDDNRQIVILDSAGKEVAFTEEVLKKNAPCISNFELEEAGTYYLGSKIGNNYIFKVVVEEEIVTEVVNELDTTTDLTAFAAGNKADGDSEKAGTENYFTLIYSEKTKVDSSSKTFEDGYKGTQRVNFGATASIEKNAIKFSTNAKATVKVYWAQGGDNNRQIVILDSAGEEAVATNETLEKNATCISTLELEEAGTYYLGSKIGNNYIFRVIVTEGGSGEKPPRADWADVKEPEITNVVVNTSDKTKVDITVKADVGYNGADKITVTMYDADGKELNSLNSSAEKSEHVLSFTPGSSGKFTFSVKAMRENEEDKIGTKVGEIQFVLPLTIPYVSSATNKGNGSVEIEWDAVTEAEGYVVTVNGEEYGKTDQLSFVVTGLTVGTTYTFGVCAVRKAEQTEAGKIEATVTQEAQRKWAFSAYGSGVDTKNNGYEGNINDGAVTVYSESGKGKIVPGSTDGLAFYYTVMDPETENFTLTATVSVDRWTLSNGQEGFGLMVSDAIGKNGDNNVFWNNSFMAISSKIEYNFDGENVTTDTSASKISMKLGLGTIAKTGVTAEEVAVLKETGKFPTGNMPAAFVTESSTLETSCGPKGGGTYNIVGNFTGAEPTGTQEETLTTFRLSIQRNNTGYILSYLDKDGNVIYKKLYYDLDKTALTSIDKEHIYLGFFASRNARITVTDVELTTIHPDDDAPAEEREIEEIYPNFVIESASVANRTDYDMVYYGNADGTLKITNSNGRTVANQTVKANTKYHFAVNLQMGNNRFTVTMTPDPNYVPGEFQKLTSYDPVTFIHNVSYNGRTANPLYVTPNGKASGTGMKNSPVDIYTAVQTASPGTVIVLAGGTYHLSKTVKVERGISGTESQKIYMIADPDAEERPVFDFGGNCAGMVLAGDYWYFYGFDVTNSADAQKGIQVSGNYNILDRICTYKNGNTGLQISRYLGTDEFEDWPSYNQILNCTSYLNADKGYEDADGFAAKLTVGNGNVFDGCIAAYNADDGWDLFAKVQSGSIGSVTIKNSLAFKNGYLMDENGNEFSAGNGNGFKMGGDSMSGYHVLEDSIAFANKAKGIDSNSCPDIQVYRSTSFDNVSYNVAMYTNTAVNTDYLADGILSYKKSNTVAEQFKLLGTQDNNKVYGTSNYYFDGTASVNTNGEQVTDAWFVDLDTEKAITNITRNADGVIQMNGYLELTASAPSQVGARLTGTTSLDAAALLAGITPTGPENNSSNTSSDNDDDDDDDDNNSNKNDYSYIGKSSLSGIEQSKISSEAASIFGSSYYIASAIKVENGICITSKSGDVIFSKNNGSLAINEWRKVGTDWYYFDADRKAAAGWKQLKGKWYYLDDSSKKMVTGWKQTTTGKWYYLDRVNGDMKTGWQLVNQVWYYLDPINGDMKVDWQWVNNKWYYLDPINGNMRTGWQLIRGKWYYLNPINGDCLLNAITPDGYTVDENGAWVQ